MQEALQVRNAPNAYAVLLGRVIEAVMDDRGATGTNLRSQIDYLKDLKAKQEIPAGLAEVAHGVRNFRNRGAHFAGSLTETEVPMLEKFTRALLEWVYSAPRLVRIAKRVAPLPPKKSIATKSNKKSKSGSGSG